MQCAELFADAGVFRVVGDGAQKLSQLMDSFGGAVELRKQQPAVTAFGGAVWVEQQNPFHSGARNAYIAIADCHQSI